jgi:hypothetical protein
MSQSAEPAMWSGSQSRGYAGGVLGGVVLAAGIWLGLVALQLGAPTESSRWTHAILQHKTRINAAAPAPRVLVMGGSNVLFGVRTRALSEETKLHFINLGAHAGLGRRYLLDHFRKALRPGDTGILCLEYQFYTESEVSEVLSDYILSRDPRYLTRLPPWQAGETLFGLTPGRLAEGLHNRFRPPTRTSQGYDEGTVDEWGDETANRGPAPQRAAARIAAAGPQPFFLHGCRIAPEAGAEITQFIREMRARGVRLYATFPGIIDFPIYHQPDTRNHINAFCAWYEGQGVPCLGRPDDYLFAREVFWDGDYHLNDLGAELHTLILLRKWAAVAGPKTQERDPVQLRLAPIKE